uniref:L-threonylcarbamoyladenylate synthase n=1 Tax=Caldisericum exile TaxID=693075 RepID=A0A7C4U166_9BACT
MDYKEVLEYLKNGGIIAFKTDTVMGLGVNGLDNEAVKRLFVLKGRSFNKPLYLLSYSFNQIYEYASHISDVALDIMEKYFPGAVTVVLLSQGKLFTLPDEPGKTIGIRIPNYPDLLDFLAWIKLPLLNTSANISGKPPIEKKSEVIATFKDAVRYVEFPHDIEMSGVPSTVVDLTLGRPVIIRKGSENKL